MNVHGNRKIGKQAWIVSLYGKTSGKRPNFVREHAFLPERGDLLERGVEGHSRIGIGTYLSPIPDMDLVHVRLVHGDTYFHFRGINHLHEGSARIHLVTHL